MCEKGKDCDGKCKCSCHEGRFYCGRCGHTKPEALVEVKSFGKCCTSCAKEMADRAAQAQADKEAREAAYKAEIAELQALVPSATIVSKVTRVGNIVKLDGKPFIFTKKAGDELYEILEQTNEGCY